MFIRSWRWIFLSYCYLVINTVRMKDSVVCFKMNLKLKYQNMQAFKRHFDFLKLFFSFIWTSILKFWVDFYYHLKACCFKLIGSLFKQSSYWRMYFTTENILAVKLFFRLLSVLLFLLLNVHLIHLSSMFTSEINACKRMKSWEWDQNWA
jgi:hypothetical protein